MARLSFRCDEELVRRVDAERGLIPREAWLRRAVEQALPPRFPTDDDAPPIVQRVREHWGEPGYDPTAEPFAPDERVRSSSQAKRGTEPYPKGGKS